MGVSCEFLYLGPSPPGRILPPKATALPDASKIGNITRDRNASCWRFIRFTNARPVSFMTSSGRESERLSASQSAGAQPSRKLRTTSPS
jgi:hypothetical protein